MDPRPPSATQLVRGVCPHDCPDACGMLTTVEGGRATRVEGDPDHPLTRGWLCAKVRPYLEWVYGPARLEHPLRRRGPKGSGTFERVTWEEALAEISSRWSALLAREGGAAILPYSYGGTLGLLQNAVASSRLWNRLGASGLERSICGAAGEHVVEAMLGARWSPDPADLAESRLIILWGHNPATTAPHTVPLVREAQRRGAYVVVIDPRRSLSARSADEHLAPRPATDGALALGLMHVLAEEGLVDEAWLARQSVGWPALRERLRAFPPARASELTGIAPERIVALARRYGTTRPAAIKIADGLQRHENGGRTVQAVASLPGLTGQYGVRGGGLWYSTSGYVRWATEAVGHPSACPPTPRVVNMNRLGAALTGEVRNPPILSLYVFAANPAASAPRSALVRQGLAREDLFTVVHDLYLTDTARFADLVLPATSQLEQCDLHKGYGQRLLRYNHAAIEPLGEARSNWDTCRALAQAMGFDDAWLSTDGDATIAEVLDATRRTNPLLEGITLDRLKREGTVPYALPAGHVPFADGRFPTPSGRLELSCEALARTGLEALPDFLPSHELSQASETDDRAPLVLLTPAAHHFVSSSFGAQASLRRRQGPALLEIHPEDAVARGIRDGARVRVHNQRGRLTLVARLSADLRRGVVCTPKGYWPSLADDGQNANATTSDRLGDVAGQSTFHSNCVWVEPEAAPLSSR
ncbi:MAG: molybdopterin oxidoreductase family protein [Deltaproteobacteria bacterium]|nr:molybdopterin oxidoreductase family protein [Deltaproteobacteria bacterium]